MALGEIFASAQKQVRGLIGSETLVSGKSVTCTTKSVGEGGVGISFLGRMGLGHYAAKADAREFSWSPSDFVPVTPIPAPVDNDIILYDGRGYQLTNVRYLGTEGVKNCIMAFAYRVLMSPDATLAPVFDTEAAQLWRPTTLAARTNPVTKAVADAGYTRAADPLTAFFVPLSMQEDLSILGAMDMRVNTLYTNDVLSGYLKLNDVVYRPAFRETWVVISPSEKQPGTGLVRAHVKHMDELPRQIVTANPIAAANPITPTG